MIVNKQISLYFAPSDDGGEFNAMQCLPAIFSNFLKINFKNQCVAFCCWSVIIGGLKLLFGYGGLVLLPLRNENKRVNGGRW